MRQYKLFKTYAIRYFARHNSSQSRFKFKEHNKKSIRPRDFIHLVSYTYLENETNLFSNRKFNLLLRLFQSPLLV